MKHYRQHKQTDELEDKFVYPHVLAMTSENLRAKAEIAEELGYRDMQIMELRDQIEAMHKSWDKNQAFDQDLLYTCGKENKILRGLIGNLVSSRSGDIDTIDGSLATVGVDEIIYLQSYFEGNG